MPLYSQYFSRLLSELNAANRQLTVTTSSNPAQKMPIHSSFVSPSTTGVKLLVPYRLSPKASIEESFDKARLSAWEYLKWKYGLNADASNADLSRACFLCHDPSAKLRES